MSRNTVSRNTVSREHPAPLARRTGMTVSLGIDSHEAYVRLEREVALLLRRSRAIQGRLAGKLHSGLDGAAYGLLVGEITRPASG